jgi:hypothetical protein
MIEFSSELHGNGLKACKQFELGDIVFTEKPYCFLQTLPNRLVVLTCGDCSNFLGDIYTQCNFLSGKCSRHEIDTEDNLMPLIPCEFKCGEFYCSIECRDNHWNNNVHKYLCTGNIPEEDAYSNALFKFKLHAASTNEIFLLAAEVFARLIENAQKYILQGKNIENGLYLSCLPLDGYVRNLWWDVVANSNSNLKQTLKNLVEESWSLLNEHFCLTQRGFDKVLSADYLARFILFF